MRKQNTLLKFLVVVVVVACDPTWAFAGPANEFQFAPVGAAYSAALAPEDSLVGRRIVLAKIFLYVRRSQGNVGNFYTDILFPIEPNPGKQNSLTLTGHDLIRTDRRTYEYVVETKMFNGRFIASRYGAETPGERFDGRLLAGSRVVFVLAPPD